MPIPQTTLDSIRNNTISSLDLSGQTLVAADAQALSVVLRDNTSLTHLYLTNNTIGIGDEGMVAIAQVLNTTVLEVLQIEHNAIGAIGLQALANALETNLTLKTLRMQDYQIDDAGAVILAEALKKNKHLVSLIFYLNNMTNIGITALAKALEINITLKEIYLGGSSWGDVGAKALADMLRINKTLTFLDIENTLIGIEGIRAVTNALNINKTLTGLRLDGYSRVDDLGAQALADTLKVNTTLTSLHIPWNNIGNAGVRALADALRINTTLRLLYLDHQDQLWDTDAQAYLISALQDNYSLTLIDLENYPVHRISQTTIDQATALMARNAAVIDAIRKLRNNTITTLDLSSQQINDTGAKLLADALRNNSSLTRLNLSSNQITEVGAAALTEVLQVNKSIIVFLFYDNQIGDLGATAIAQALKINKTLDTLDLNSNHIGDPGAIAIGKALEINTRLAYLYLYANQIGNNGVTALANALKLNKFLAHLIIHSNQIGNSGAQSIAETLKVNMALREIDLQYSQIGDEGAVALLIALQNNYSVMVFGLIGNPITQILIDQINTLMTRNQQYPFFSSNHIEIKEGETLKLSAANIQAGDALNRPIIFTVTHAEHGHFINARNETIMTFTQAQITAGEISFVADDFNKKPIRYSLTASNGNFTTPAHPAVVAFIPVNHAPRMICSAPTKTVTVSDPFELNLGVECFEDRDNDTLRFSIAEGIKSSPLFSAFTFNEPTGLLTGVAHELGSVRGNLTVIDSGNLTASTPFELDIVPSQAVSTSSSSSQAWITGPVVGVAALLTVAGVGLYRRHRPQKVDTLPTDAIPPMEMNPLHGAYATTFFNREPDGEPWQPGVYEIGTEATVAEPSRVVGESMTDWDDHYETGQPHHII